MIQLLAVYWLVAGLPQAPEAVVFLEQAPAALHIPTLPKGAQRYNPFPRYTQSIFILNADGKRMDTVERVRVTDPKWCNPGGLKDVKVGSWRSEKYRYIPSTRAMTPVVKYWIERVPVQNSSGVTQHHIALRRSYPDGTRFDEVLKNADTGLVFEHRRRMKENGGKWKSSVVFEDPTSRPVGYVGLGKGETCNSCHEQTGTGKYASGLVPGGDTVISDPMDFTQFKRWPAVNYRPEPYPTSALETVKASYTEPLELRRLIQRIRQRIRPTPAPAMAFAPEQPTEAMGWSMPSMGAMAYPYQQPAFMGYPGTMQPYAQPSYAPALPQAPSLMGYPGSHFWNDPYVRGTSAPVIGRFQQPAMERVPSMIPIPIPTQIPSTIPSTIPTLRGSYYSPGNRGGGFGSGGCPLSG